MILNCAKFTVKLFFIIYLLLCCTSFISLLSDIDPPRGFEVTESTETSLTLKWQKPQAKVSGYMLVYVSGDSQLVEVEIPATATSYVVSNLTPGMSYNLILTAERGHKRSTPVTLPASTGG